MFQQRIVPTKFQSDKYGQLDFAKSVACSLMHNAISYVLERESGEWLFIVKDKDVTILDEIIQNVGAA